MEALKTGFYDTSKLTAKKQLALVKDAIQLAFSVQIQSKYTRAGSRSIEYDYSIKQALELGKTLKVVDRSIQYPILQEGEIVWMTTSFNHPKYNYDPNYPNNGWLLLYCNLSLDNLQILTKKYKLIIQ